MFANFLKVQEMPKTPDAFDEHYNGAVVGKQQSMFGPGLEEGADLTGPEGPLVQQRLLYTPDELKRMHFETGKVDMFPQVEEKGGIIYRRVEGQVMPEASIHNYLTRGSAEPLQTAGNQEGTEPPRHLFWEY